MKKDSQHRESPHTPNRKTNLTLKFTAVLKRIKNETEIFFNRGTSSTIDETEDIYKTSPESNIVSKYEYIAKNISTKRYTY